MAFYTGVRDPWYTWNSTSANTTCNVWPTWVNETASITMTSVNHVWYQWQSMPPTYGYYTASGGSYARQSSTRKCPHDVVYDSARETREAQCETCKTEYVKREKLANHLDRSRRRRREMAELRAIELLMEHLDEDQRQEYERDRQFHAVCPRSGRRFKIRRQWSGNLDEYEGGKITKRHCVHHSSPTPVEDNMLTQKFMIEAGLTDELVRIANTTSVG